MKDDWPSHTEELTRKTAEALNDLAYRHSAGEISAEAAFVAAGVLWDVTAGLVDRDLMDLLTQVRAAFKKEAKK